VDVPTTQSQPTESTQGTHRITSAPRIPNPVTTKGELSALRKSIMIRFHVLRRQDPETPIPTAAKIDHMVDEELDKLLDENENVDVDEFMDDILNNQEDPATRIEPRSENESSEEEMNADLAIVNNNEEEEGSTKEALIKRNHEKRKGIKEIRNLPPPTPIKFPRTHIAPLSTDKETLQELTVITEDALSSADKKKLKELTVSDPTTSYPVLHHLHQNLKLDISDDTRVSFSR
ncbi:hypothetical protein Tco_0967329, partial [Tanacetum coccineum]